MLLAVLCYLLLLSYCRQCWTWWCRSWHGCSIATSCRADQFAAQNSCCLAVQMNWFHLEMCWSQGQQEIWWRWAMRCSCSSFRTESEELVFWRLSCAPHGWYLLSRHHFEIKDIKNPWPLISQRCGQKGVHMYVHCPFKHASTEIAVHHLKESWADFVSPAWICGPRNCRYILIAMATTQQAASQLIAPLLSFFKSMPKDTNQSKSNTFKDAGLPVSATTSYRIPILHSPDCARIGTFSHWHSTVVIFRVVCAECVYDLQTLTKLTGSKGFCWFWVGFILLFLRQAGVSFDRRPAGMTSGLCK